MRRDDAIKRGLEVRTEVLGEDYVNSSMAPADEHSAEFQQFVIEHCWGNVWLDDRLTRRERSLLVLAITAALGRMAEFKLHAVGALRNGLTKGELVAAVEHIGVYAGIPASVSAMHVLREVFRDFPAA